MYQLAIRLFPSILTVYDVTLGRITDGQFVPVGPDFLPNDTLDYIKIDDLLGTQAYMLSSDLSPLAKVLLDAGATVQLFSNFIIFTLPENYVTEEEEIKK